MKRSLRALLWWPVGLLAGVLLLEATLQLAALVTKDQTRQVQARWLTSHTRILAVGDSNTYGFYLEAGEAWPAQLEAQWNVAHPQQLVEVLNLGYPGTNSFRVRESLPGLLDTLSPDIVLLMVGFNDFWTPVEQVAAPGTPQDLAGWVAEHSRLYRFYRIWSRSRVQQADLAFGASRDPLAPVDVANPAQHQVRIGEEAFYLGTKQGEPARNRNALADNLAAMVTMAQARDAKVLLLTYPSNWGFYPGANKWVKVAAEQNGVPLVDITPLFIARCSDGPPSCPALLFHDGHATAEGNRLVAEAAGNALQSLMGRKD
jgi:lysophospholipase L1-like esterase